MNFTWRDEVIKHFPQLKTKVHDKPLIYLDSAATTLKPQVVIDSLTEHYQSKVSNIHRGVHYLSELSTTQYENSRNIIQQFLNAQKPSEIIFTKGTTEGINLVANSFGETFLKEGDEIILSQMEHHSNIVPWQILAAKKNLKIQVIPLLPSGDLDIDTYEKLLSSKTKLVSVVHISNSLGTINPVKKMIEMAHNVGAKVLIDGAQAVQHTRVDVQELDADFYVFSGHKIYGPEGTGVLYGKEELLNEMPPYQGGGDMIATVSFEKTTYNTLPYKFEAGTPHISGGIILGVAVQFLQEIGLAKIKEYEDFLLDYATTELLKIEGLNIIGQAKEKSSVISFTLDSIHPHDMGTFLDRYGVALRTGHHCTQPVMDYFKVSATSRISIAFYNSKEDIDQLVEGIKKIKNFF